MNLPRIESDPFDVNTLRDPLHFQELAREAGPVFWIDKYRTYGVARYDEVRVVTSDYAKFNSSRGCGLGDITAADSWREPGPLVEIDPPDHTKLRSILNRIISPVVIRGWRTDFEKGARSLCDEALRNGNLDGVTDLAEAFVMKVFPDSLGVEVNRDNLIIIGNHNFNTIGPKNELFAQTEAKLNSISEWYAATAKQDQMLPGGFGEKIFQAEIDGDLAEGLAYKLLRSLLRGGFDTTISGLGSTLWMLATHPGEYDAIRENPALVKNAFEESLRLQSPVQTYYRTTNEGAELAGVKLQANTKIQVFIGAANRDPRKWDLPAQFNIKRNLNTFLAFGDGVHRCLGQMIARAEAESFLTEFVKRVKKVRLAGEPKHRLLNALRTLDTLPLEVTLA